jgi:DNA-binding Lrp family transcriptional regulator
MPRKDLEQAMLSAIEAKGLDGLEPARMPGLGDVSRSTINRVLAALVAKGNVRAIARGRNTRYILECWVITGDTDYLLKIYMPDPTAFDRFFARFKLKINGVRQIKTAVALHEVKNETRLQLPGAGTELA